MENVKDQNPFASPKSPANQQEKQTGRSNECLWMGIISAVGFAAGYAFPRCFEELSAGAAIASMVGMLTFVIAGTAAVAGVTVGGIEVIAQLSSKSVFGQKETVFIGVALSLAGPVVLMAMYISRFF